jgi:hypothetical protein
VVGLPPEPPQPVKNNAHANPNANLLFIDMAPSAAFLYLIRERLSLRLRCRQ